MKIVYMGTPDFAVAPLEALLAAGHTVTAVVTQPDKPKGRSGKLQMSPVKECALQHDIPVLQPVKIKRAEEIERLRQYEADVYVVAAFGQILSQEILDLPHYGSLCIHASLLPAYRGASPINRVIMDGQKKSGVTIMQMDEGLDTGDMLLKTEVDIAEDETGESLHDKLAALGSDLLLRTLDAAEKGQLKPEKQQDDESTYAGMLSKEMGRIDWEKSAVEIERMIRGLNSWPSAFSGRQGKTMKFWKASVCPENTDKKPGTIVKVGKNTFMIQTGDGCLEALEVQLEGKKRMDAGSFLRGVHLEEGECLCI